MAFDCDRGAVPASCSGRHSEKGRAGESHFCNFGRAAAHAEIRPIISAAKKTLCVIKPRTADGNRTFFYLA